MLNRSTVSTPSVSKPTVSTTTTSTITTAAHIRQRMAGLGAIGGGVLLLFVVGFMPTSAVHNAAHDARHSAAFPCH